MGPAQVRVQEETKTDACTSVVDEQGLHFKLLPGDRTSPLQPVAETHFGIFGLMTQNWFGAGQVCTHRTQSAHPK